MPKIDIAMPTIHVNGDTTQTLFDQNIDAMLAIELAIDVAIKAGPHGRNFYVQGGEALPRAIREHDARIKVLNQLALEYRQIAEHVQPKEVAITPPPNV